MDFVLESIKKFYLDFERELKDNYPGISLERLLQEVPDVNNNFHLDSYFEGLMRGVPLEYLSGKAYFYKSEFIVNPNVLIPRYETEILVEKSLEYLKTVQEKDDLFIVDVGTGSGAVLLSIVLELDKAITAVGIDLFDNALDVAKENYFKHRFSIHPDTKIHWEKDDRLFNYEFKKADLIVSNPPYIKNKEGAKYVHHQVLKYEPHVALFLDDKKYESWFFTLFQQVFQNLAPDGIFIMEGHEQMLEEQKSMAQHIGFKNIVIEKDLTQRDRFLIARK